MMALGMFVTVFGAGNWINELENPTPNGIGMTVFFVGALIIASTIRLCNLRISL